MLETLAAISKAFVYAGSLTAAGLALAAASLRPRLGDRQGATWVLRLAAFVALISCAAWMFVLFLRLGGDPSAPVLSAMFLSSTGWWAGLLLVGSSVLLATGLTGPRLLLLLGGAASVAAFGINGHAPSLGAAQGLVAAVHVAAAAWWLGGLAFLYAAARSPSRSDLPSMLKRFSTLAAVVIGVLAAAGAALVVFLVDLSHQPWLSAYGQVLAVKIALVVFALSVAAFNRFRLTTHAISGDAAATARLKRNIAIEVFVICIVFVAMAVLTTWTSPHG